ncbi:hypothetical protein DOY81_010127 [Sarcophaga bullata]|nr:hypothetical protein DOY81_010127 [Sarcophaga bullata]
MLYQASQYLEKLHGDYAKETPQHGNNSFNSSIHSIIQIINIKVV